MSGVQAFCRTVGLHPLVGFGMFAVDWMLFGGNVATAGAGCVVSVPVALLLTIPSVLIQKHQFHDGWGAAVGKGMMVGVLTAIPTPLPSVVSLAGGSLGTASLLMPGGARTDHRTLKDVSPSAERVDA